MKQANGLNTWTEDPRGIRKKAKPPTIKKKKYHQEQEATSKECLFIKNSSWVGGQLQRTPSSEEDHWKVSFSSSTEARAI
ncbi:hypothetical protein JTE90_014648 [Oedothorax gibbosus]|uniref:Uncharacterized protein n=1 Tax=Oedothorax gibbosus TaxID=931172 RepID=A0AAV6V9K2_9ARAC|nr:hypothetical protein JTE90_014648 [Oedothorax gibbosus]